jgi:hypothetical protein
MDFSSCQNNSRTSSEELRTIGGGEIGLRVRSSIVFPVIGSYSLGFLPRRDPHHLHGVADDIGGAFFAFRTCGHQESIHAIKSSQDTFTPFSRPVLPLHQIRSVFVTIRSPTIGHQLSEAEGSELNKRLVRGLAEAHDSGERDPGALKRSALRELFATHAAS